MKIRRSNPFLGFFRHLLVSSGIVLSMFASAQTLYWDTNGTTAGSGNAGGTWDAGTNWNADPTGTADPTGWSNGNSAVFSAGTDGTGSWTSTISATVNTPSITFLQGGTQTISGGILDVTPAGGLNITSSAAGNGSGNSKTIASAISGTGPLTLALNGDMSPGGNGSNTYFSLTSTTSNFTGDITITNGLLSWSNDAALGDPANKIILNGGGIIDPNLSRTSNRNIEVGPAGGTIRTWGSVNGFLNGSISSTSETTLQRTDGGTLTLNGSAAAFTGTFINQRGTLRLGTTDWSNAHFVQTDGGNVLRLDASGTTTIRSLVSDRDIIIPFGSRLNISDGTYTTIGAGTDFNGFWAQGTAAGNAAATGEITSSSGTLTVTNGSPTGNLTTTDNRIRLKITDFGSGPNPTLAVVKNNNNSLTFDMVNTYSGGTTINGGRINGDNLSAFGTGTVTVNPGGQAALWAGGTFTNNFVIGGSGVTEGAGNLGAIRLNGNTLSGSVHVASAASIVAYGTSGTLTGAITGSADLSLNHAGSPGTIILSGDASAYTGSLNLVAGTLNVGSAGLGGDLVVTDGTANVSGNIAGNVIINAGTTTLNAAVAGSVTVNGGRTNINGATGGDVTVADLAKLGGEGTITGSLSLGSSDGADLHINAATPQALTAGSLTLTGTNRVLLDTLPVSTDEFAILEYTTLAAGDESNFEVPTGIFRGDPQVQHDVDNNRFILQLDSQVRTWNNSSLTGTWNASDTNWDEGDNLFYSGDEVVFTDNAAGLVNLATGLQPLSITLQNTSGNDYTFAGGEISGSTGIQMTGGGNLSLGGANSFSGTIQVDAGVLQLSTATALGQTSGVTVAPGARVDLNGQAVGNLTNTTWTISGNGGGAGAITNTGGSVFEDSSIFNLTLAGDASVGGNNGRFDIGRHGINGLGGNIQGAGFTLTKIGSNAMVFRGPATDITYVVNEGMLTFENFDSASGTNTITVNNANSTVGSYGDRTHPNDVVLNEGTRLISQSGNGAWTGTVTANGSNVTFQADGNLVIDGALAGAANVTKAGGGILCLQNTATAYSGKITVTGGTLRVENAGVLGTATGADVLSIGNATLQGGTIAGAASATIGSATQGITQTGNTNYDAGAGNTLTIEGAITGTGNLVKPNNTGALVLNQPVTLTGYAEGNNGSFQFNQAVNLSGAFRTGTNMVATISGPGGSIGSAETDTAGGIRMWSSTLNLSHTGTLNVWDIQVQEGSGQAATINHTSGTVNVTRDIRIGHWGGATSVYNLSGGELNQPDTVTNPTDEGQANLFLGIDGTGILNQSGGTINTTSLVLDGRGDTAGDDIYAMTGGRLNMGKWGIRSGNAGTSKRIELGGGTLGASADWSTTLPIILTGTNGNVTIDTLDSANATTPRAISLAGGLTGSGGLRKINPGSLSLSGTGTFTGIATVEGGSLLVNGNAAAAGTLRTTADGVLRAGTLTGTGSANTANLTLDGGAVDFRIGNTSDLINVSGALAVDSATAIRAIPLNAISGPFPRTFQVIDYSGTVGGAAGFAGLSFSSSNPHLAGELVNDTENSVIQIQINSADSVVWKGNVNGNWDVNTTDNWVLDSDGVTPTRFYDFDVVIFDDDGIATPDVTLAGTITPATLSVNNSTGTYSFAGSPISGGTGLTKSGAGTLRLLNNNTFTGTVAINGGRLEVGDGGANGTLGGSGTINLELGASLAFNTSSNALIPATRPINGGGALEKSGTGTLELQGTHAFSGGTNIHGGTVLLSSGGGQNGVISGEVTVHPGGTLAASAVNAFGWGAQRIHTLQINGGTVTTSAGGDQGWSISILMGDNGTLASTGSGNYSLGGGSSLSYTGTTQSAQVTGTVRLREGNPDNLLPVSVADGAAAHDLVISGPITQSAAGYGLAKSGAGTLLLSGDNSFTGNLRIDEGMVRISRPQHSVVAQALTGSGSLDHASPQELLLLGDGSAFGGAIHANGKVVRLGHENAGAGTGGTLHLAGGTLALGLQTEGVLFNGTFSGAAMVTTPLQTNTLASGASGLHGGIGGNTTIAYDGEIFLTAGDWSFGENVDDAVYVNINGITILNDNGWNVVTTGTFTAPADGWYPITLRVQNGGGGNGPVGDWATAGIGIGIKQGGGSTNVADYTRFDIGVLGTRSRVARPAGEHTMAGALALGGGTDNTIDTAGGSLALNGPVTGAASDRLVKTGAGTLALNAVNSYAGDTVVRAGTLAVNGSSLPDAITLVLDGGILDVTNQEYVSALRFGDVPQALGSYGATGSGADFIDDTRFSGTGMLIVGPAPAGGYDAWAAAITDETKRGRTDDADGDGLSNLQEYLFGSNPNAAEGSLVSTETSAGTLTLRWKQLLSGGAYQLQESLTLLNGSWVPSDITPTTDGAPAGDYQPMKAEVPATLEKRFFRVEGAEN